jgi:hypothetical protein
MRRERGLTLSGFLLWAVLGVFVALFGFKVGPAYFEYYTIKRQLKAIADDPDAVRGGARGVANAFERRAAVENMSSITGNDIQITKDGDRVILSAEYSVKVPLFGNLSACMDFTASSDK